MAEPLAGIRLAAVAVADNGWHPPEIVELAVVHVDDGAIRRGPLVWTVCPERMPHPATADRHGVPVQRVRSAPPWGEVFEHVTEALAGRVLAAYDLPPAYRVLRRRLPDEPGVRVLDVYALARLAWPELDRFDLHSLVSHAAQVLVPGANVAVDAAPTSPGNDAHATAIVLLALARTAGAATRFLTAPALGQ